MSAPTRRSVRVEGLAHAQPIPNATIVGNLLISSSIFGKDPVTGVVPEDPAAEVAQAFENLRAVLAAAGASLDNVVKLNVSTVDRSIREHLNPLWLEAFPDPDSRPARHTAEAVMTGMRLQLEVIAVLQ